MKLTNVEILLQSSNKEVCMNDQQQIGFQKGAKWVRDIPNDTVKQSYTITNNSEDCAWLDVNLTAEQYALLIGIFDMLNKNAPDFAPIIEIKIN